MIIEEQNLNEAEKPQLNIGAVSESVRIKSLEKAIAEETNFQNKWHLEESLRITKNGLRKDAPYIPMMP